MASARLPALLVRLRPAGRAPGLPEHDLLVEGQLDTGAYVSAVHIWLLRRSGILIDESTRHMVYGASGPFWAYSAKIGIEIMCDRTWVDIGVANVLVPDTPWSRDPNIRRPILLGLGGFFDRVQMCIDHSREEFWLRLPQTAGAGIGQRAAEPPRV